MSAIWFPCGASTKSLLFKIVDCMAFSIAALFVGTERTTLPLRVEDTTGLVDAEDVAELIMRDDSSTLDWDSRVDGLTLTPVALARCNPSTSHAMPKLWPCQRPDQRSCCAPCSAANVSTLSSPLRTPL